MSLKNLRRYCDTIDTIIYLVCIFILFTVVNKSYKKSAYFILCIIGIFVLFKLDLNFALKIEGKHDDKKLCINPDKFNIDSHKELGNYVENFNYYNNIWRIALLSSIVISLFIVKFVPDIYIGYMPYIITVVFCVIYHAFHWKIHHSYDFIFKTVRDACDQRKDNKNDPYVSLVHI